MMAVQSLKRSLATQRLTTKKDAHTHTNKTVQTENMVDGEVMLEGWLFRQKQTRLLKQALRRIFR